MPDYSLPESLATDAVGSWVSGQGGQGEADGAVVVNDHAGGVRFSPVSQSGQRDGLGAADDDHAAALMQMLDHRRVWTEQQLATNRADASAASAPGSTGRQARR